MLGFLRINISLDRAATVYNIINRGSQPELRFYYMVAASAVLATLGLVMDSTAVVIGAMLVAPLMTPIFGISLALVRGDAELLGKAIQAEIVGILLVIVLAGCIGFAIPEMEITREMVTRTKPNLLDLLVAVFAGFAGSYALVDEHISPALPGVAIATAIVPPLANTGLCIALGSYNGAVGSFLLFFANFLSILLIAAIIFAAGGLGRNFGAITTKTIARRFGLAAIGFIIVTALLGKGLYDITQERLLKNQIKDVLTEAFSHLPATSMEKIVHQKHKDKFYVLAHVLASGDITPYRVKLMEEALEEKLRAPVELFVRSTLSEDISSTGSTNQVDTTSLDGFFISREPDPHIKLIKLSEQVIREYMDTQPALYVEETNLFDVDRKSIILATIFGLREMNADEIGTLEERIRQRSGNESLILLIRHVDVKLQDKLGKFHYETSSFKPYSQEQMALIAKTQNFLKKEFDGSKYILLNSNSFIHGDVTKILVELAGPNVYTPEAFLNLKKKLRAQVGEKVEVYVYSKPEVVLTDKGYASFDEIKTEFLKDAESLYDEELKQIFKESL